MSISALTLKKQAFIMPFAAAFFLILMFSMALPARASMLFSSTTPFTVAGAGQITSGAFVFPVTFGSSTPLYVHIAGHYWLGTGTFGCQTNQGTGGVHFYNSNSTIEWFVPFQTITPQMITDLICTGNDFDFVLPMYRSGGGGNYIYANATSSASGVTLIYGANNMKFTFTALQISTLNDFPDTKNTATRISYVSPYNGQPMESGSAINLEALGYINPSIADLGNVDDHSGIQIRWNVYSTAAAATNCIDVICAFNTSNKGYTYYSGTGYSVFGSPFFDVSTTSDVLPDDIYTLTTSIIKPVTYFGLGGLFGFSFGNEAIVSTTTSFTVGEVTELQTLINNIVTLGTNQGLGNLSATTTEAAMSACNMISFSFNLGDCLTVLFYPNTANMTRVFDTATHGFLTRAPWGYVTRLVTILTNNATSTSATSTLPAFTVSFASSSPMYGSDMTFDMQDMVMGGASLINGITDPISGKSMREITEPWIQLFIAITALSIIFHDIMSMGGDSIARGSGEGGSFKNRNSSKYREWLYTHKS
jgi:hypothetical protein